MQTVVEEIKRSSSGSEANPHSNPDVCPYDGQNLPPVYDMFSENDKSSWSKLLDRLQDGQPKEEEDVEDCAFLEAAPSVERLMTWGILNPFGPTVESLCLATDPSGKAKVIFLKTSNPLENSTDALGTVNADMPHDDLIRAVIDSTTGGPGSSSRIFQSEPTFVIPSTGGLTQHLDAFAIVFRNLSAAENIDLASEADRLKRFWLNPWARLPSPEELFATARSQGLVQTKMSKTLFSEWWSLVTNPEHVESEWRAIVEAWQGAIEFLGNSPMAKMAIPAAEALAFQMRLLEQAPQRNLRTEVKN